MSMMDILNRKSMELRSPESESSTSVLGAKAPVITRLEAAMRFMVRDFMESPNSSGKAKFMARKILEEAMSELQEAPPEIIEEHFMRSTALMYWVSTGQTITNLDMPDGFWDFAGPDIPQLSAPQVSALNSGQVVE